MNRKYRLFALIPALMGLLFVGWQAQSESVPAAKQRWLRVISTEMELAPRMNRTFLPRPYQYVEVAVGAGEFGRVTANSVVRRSAPSGYNTGVRLDTSDDDFLVVAVGDLDNLGKWRNRTVHYIPWDKIVDILFEVSAVSGGVVR